MVGTGSPAHGGDVVERNVSHHLGLLCVMRSIESHEDKREHDRE